MNAELKKYVTDLLNDYQKRARKIALLHHELAEPSKITDHEMIDAMNFAHHDGMGRSEGHISNKTLYIALNYQEKAERLNAEAFNEVSARLTKLEREQSTLEYYVSLLESRQRQVIQKIYFERASQEQVAKELDLSVRRVQDIKAQAIVELVEMYAFTASLY